MQVYTLLLFFCFFSPLLSAFLIKEYEYFRNAKSIIFSSIIVSMPFLLWDYYFTKNEVWGFTQKYVIGLYFFGLPIEEILFFIIIPFACFFIYFVLKSKGYSFKTEIVSISLRLYLLVSIFMLYAYIDKVYTVTVTIFGIVSYFLIVKTLSSNEKKYLVTMLILSIVPFLIVNGVLTSFPVVWYNTANKSDIMIDTIPLEDLLYSWSLLSLNFIIYTKIKENLFLIK